MAASPLLLQGATMQPDCLEARIVLGLPILSAVETSAVRGGGRRLTKNSVPEPNQREL